jgi:hypothetical protein
VDKKLRISKQLKIQLRPSKFSSFEDYNCLEQWGFKERIIDIIEDVDP